MFLGFDTKEEMEQRNIEGYNALNYPFGETNKRWSEIEHDGIYYLNVGDGEGLTQDELNNCVETLETITGAYYRRTGELDENGNYYLEYTRSVTLSDGTVIDHTNKSTYDGTEGWHWYSDGEVVKIATPTTWDKIKNFLKIN